MKRERHGSRGALSDGVSAKPHSPTPDEAPHKPLARGSFAKDAKRYKEGEMSHEEFHGAIKRAHSRLQDPMMMPMAFPTKVVKERSTHRKRKAHG